MAAASDATLPQRTLVIFDFDRSLMEEDTDQWSMKLCGDEAKALMDGYKHKQDSWTDLVGKVFAAIHRAGISQDQFESHMRQMIVHPNMLAACRFLTDRPDVDCMVLSDSNSVFIETILTHHSLREGFKRIVTNPAYFDSDGCLQVSHCHAHGCAICPSNLCKGSYVDDFRSAEAYDKVVYIGDGGGDFCGAMRLSAGDTVLARTGYTLIDKLGKTKSLKANLVPWTDGTDVLDWFRENLD